MSTYLYEATDKSGIMTHGHMEADNQNEVALYLEKKELIPIKIEKIGIQGEAGLSLSSGIFETVRAIDRISLVRNLAVTLKAGLNILEALDILLKDATKRIIKKILNQAKTDLESGQPLSSTFASYPRYFPPIFIGLIRAGEVSGRLDESLNELAQQLSKDYQLGKKVKSALAYPFILLVSSIGIIVLLLVFILPRLTKIFKLSGVKLPAVTQFFVNVSNTLAYSPALDLAVLIILIISFIAFRRTKNGRKFFLRISFRIPVANNLIKKLALIKFTRTLGTLISNGIPIVDALKLSADTVNDFYKDAILASIEKIKEGIALSRALEAETKLFPNLLINMIAVGEKTGTMDQVLKTFADFYDEEVDNTLKDLTTFLEPILLLFMGLVIGAIALAILLPIYQLIGKFS